MMSNSTTTTRDPVRDALKPTLTVQPRTTAHLSSVERSQLMDGVVAQLGAVTRQVQRLTTGAVTQQKSLDDQRFQQQAFVARDFWQRLRWLVRG